MRMSSRGSAKHDERDAEQSRPRCVLHIGSEKTGTTTIQHYLSRHRELLLTSGYWYPRSLAYEDGFVHRRLSDLGRDQKGSHAEETRDAFRQEYETAVGDGVKTAIISSEFLHSLIRTPKAVGAIRDFLTPYFESIRIVYYARRQDELAASMHSTAIRGGQTTESALAMYDGKGHHYFDHLQVCDLWASAFGCENLVCRIFERDKLVNADIVDDFASIAGFTPDTEREKISSNESLPLETMRALMMFNGSRHRKNKEFRRVLIAKGRRRGGKRVPMMTKSEASEFLDRFNDSNARFFQKYVDPSLAKNFSRDFSRFPDEIPPVSAEELLEFMFGKDA